jgi:hypothetical protein
MTKAGTYTIFYDVALQDYPINFKPIGTPFKVMATKPNSAPTLASMFRKQAIYSIEIPPESSD